MNRMVMWTGPVIGLAATLALPSPVARAETEPEPNSRFMSSAAVHDGTVRVEGQVTQPHIVPRSRARSRAQPATVLKYAYGLKCGEGGPVIIGASGRCPEAKCLTIDGRQGRWYIVYTYEVEVATGRATSKWAHDGDVCRPDDVASEADLSTLILREFKSLALPALKVRSTPEGRTFVHLPTTFSVEKAERDRDLGTILEHHVTVSIRPVSYRWSFGDGSVRTTSAHGKHAPAASVRHSFDEPATVEVSVRTTYRARYRVDGGSPREIADPVSVDGPATVLPVEQARTELVAPRG
jgi:hypothetical protein